MQKIRRWVEAALGSASQALVALVLAASTPSFAQDLEPRAYSNTPIGLNFLLAGYTYTKGGVAVDPSVPLTDAHLQVSTAILAYSHSLDAWGRSAKFDLVLPYAWLSGTAQFAGQPVQRRVSGFGDPRFRFSVNFYGAPALTVKEFADYRQDLILGASVYVSAPWSQYDPSKLVNIGTNRWSYKAELGISKAMGEWTFELVPGVMFYSDNTNFLDGNTRAQDPIYSVQAHVIYSLPHGVWVAVDGTYFTGGRSSVNGISDNNRQSNSRGGITLALPIDRSSSLKFYGSNGISTRLPGGNYKTVGVVWQYRWGGGY